ncbi:MAG TPA: hypothetical protein VJN43_03435 [Bryobacteraceae bacterium]|nr:hypothetical protein [Bryobacteraceae bacterium]
MDVVVDAAWNVEMLAGWVEDDAIVRVGDRYYLFLSGSLAGDIVDEDELVDVGRGGGIDDDVEPASQRQQSLMIGADHGSHRLSGEPAWVVGETGVHRLEMGTEGRQRRDLNAHVGQILRAGIGRVLRQCRGSKKPPGQRETRCWAQQAASMLPH